MHLLNNTDTPDHQSFEMSTVTMSPQPAHNLGLKQSSSLRQSTLKKNMSITQTYYLAHKARGKLSREAAQPDHDLRLLVGHANLLDTLMLELADAEREQERWFNQSVRENNKKSHSSTTERRVQWADQIIEEEEYDSDSSDSSDDDFEEDEDVEMVNAPSTQPQKIQYAAVIADRDDDVEEDDDEEEDFAQLGLVRTHSHSNSPPELVAHDDESSDDESMPPSPRSSLVETFEEPSKDEDAKNAEQGDEFFEEDYMVPTRTHTTGLVTAISVY